MILEDPTFLDRLQGLAELFKQDNLQSAILALREASGRFIRDDIE